MRYVTLRITSEGASFHTIPRAVVPDSVGRGRIDRIELLDDGSAVVLQAVSGDLSAYEGVLAETEGVHSFSLAGHDEGHAFIHYEPTEATRALLRWCRRFPMVRWTPIEFAGEDPIITLVGAVNDFADATASLPEPVTYELVETGQFAPNRSAPFQALTARQREILATAIGLGYYENPREATQAEVASALSLAPGTVGDHLRTIEAHVFSGGAELVGDALDPA